MAENSEEQIREMLDSVYRAESGRILATLIRLLGDFDLAEDAVHDAFAAALDRWPKEGVPGESAGVAGFDRDGSRPSMPCAVARASMRRRKRLLNSSRTNRAGKRMTKASGTINCV